jgi:ATP-dependent protease HslVU (ClpYQ) peptidase subunit
MTTIATDGITIAADSLTTYGNERGRRPAKKLHVRTRLDGTRIFAFSGAASMAIPVIEWFEAGAVAKDGVSGTDKEPWLMLVLDREGMFNVYSGAPYVLPFDAPFAIGSGGDYALGAMMHGATAAESVGVAAKLDITTGGDVQVFNIAEALGLNKMAEAAE